MAVAESTPSFTELLDDGIDAYEKFLQETFAIDWGFDFSDRADAYAGALVHIRKSVEEALKAKSPELPPCSHCKKVHIEGEGVTATEKRTHRKPTRKEMKKLRSIEENHKVFEGLGFLKNVVKSKAIYERTVIAVLEDIRGAACEFAERAQALI